MQSTTILTTEYLHGETATVFKDPVWPFVATTGRQLVARCSVALVASNLLKRAEIYPDSTGSSDQITFTYNRAGQPTSITDQLGTVHSFDFDKLGRPVQDRVTTLGTGVDAAIRRIETAYEVRGMVSRSTSFDNATVGPGAIVNEVRLTYNTFGQPITDQQSHSGAVTGSTAQVQYAFANGSANTNRPSLLTNPNSEALGLLSIALSTINPVLAWPFEKFFVSSGLQKPARLGTLVKVGMVLHPKRVSLGVDC